MQVSVDAGTYVLAVSGGVDSMVLLELLRKRPGIKLIVAHYDHGIRPDSAKDRKLVQGVAKRHGLAFVYQNGHLGPTASEAAARTARYRFLREIQATSKARAIITAHHQDDVLETAIINMLRGTGRRGLTALTSSNKVLRPLLGYTKEQVREYAANHSLKWREDPTNADTRFKRNHVRHTILPRFSAGQRAQLLILLDDLRALNYEADRHIVNLLHSQPALDSLDRQWFILLPHSVASEVVHAWLRRYNARNLTRQTVERLVIAMKTSHPGRRVDVDQAWVLAVNSQLLALVPRDR